MKSEDARPIINWAESFHGRLVTTRSQVPDTEIVVALSCSYTANSIDSIVFVFSFPDEVTRGQFRDAVMRSYEDQTLIAPWKVNEYMSESAGDFFRRFGGSGTSGAPMLSTTMKDG